jgi:hypothetical protein
VELLFACLGIAGFIVGIYMNYYDWHHGSKLNRGALNALPEDGGDAQPPTTTTEPDADIVVVSPMQHGKAKGIPIDHSGSGHHSNQPGYGYSAAPTSLSASPTVDKRTRTVSGTGLLTGTAGVGMAAVMHHREGSVDGRSSLRSRGSRGSHGGSRDGGSSATTRMFSDEKSRLAALKALQGN